MLLFKRHLKELFWYGTAATLCTCWPSRSGPHVVPQVYGSSTAVPGFCSTPAPRPDPTCHPSPTCPAWCSTTWDHRGKQRRGRWRRRPLPNPLCRQFRRHLWYWNWSGLCTSPRASPRYSISHVSSLTGTLTVLTSYHSRGLSCASYRTIPSRYEESLNSLTLAESA